MIREKNTLRDEDRENNFFITLCVVYFSFVACTASLDATIGRPRFAGAGEGP